jgi:hypothetical protein
MPLAALSQSSVTTRPFARAAVSMVDDTTPLVLRVASAVTAGKAYFAASEPVTPLSLFVAIGVKVTPLDVFVLTSTVFFPTL